MKKFFLVCCCLVLAIPAIAADFVPDAVIDTMLDEIATATRVDIVSDSSTPANLDNTLANVTVTAGDGNGDFVIAAGDTSGRKITLSEQESISITGTGTARHIVLSLSGTILLVRACTPVSLTSGGTVTIPAFDHEILDP